VKWGKNFRLGGWTGRSESFEIKKPGRKREHRKAGDEKKATSENNIVVYKWRLVAGASATTTAKKETGKTGFGHVK